MNERLVVRDLDAGYGRLQILRNISLEVGAGEFVAVLGANGAGKTTLLRAISRCEARVMKASVTFDGQDISELSTEAIVARGLLHVPEGRRLFTELTVDDNLRLGGFLRAKDEVAAAVATVYERFPALAARKRSVAFALSGGEQQMLAIGRALGGEADAPDARRAVRPASAPRVVESIFAIIAALRDEGTSILLVEQNARLTLRYADRAYIIEHGEIALSGKASELAVDPRVQSIYLGAGSSA